MSTSSLPQSSTLGDLRELVARISAKAPELASRAEAAASIALFRKIDTDPEFEGAFLVEGSDGRTHRVDASDACSCQDYQRRGIEAGGKKWCKHVIALLLIGRLAAQGKPSNGHKPASRPVRLAEHRRRRARGAS